MDVRLLIYDVMQLLVNKIMNINAVLCLLGITALSALGAGAEDDLPTPCRAWQLPCGNQDYTCTTEESYTLSSLYGPQLGCDDVFNATATPPPGECLLVNGSCRYSTNLLNCTTWLPDCYSEYQCGTFEADNNNESPTLCSNVPPPNSTCIQINGSCQWYNPCRMWRGFCYNPWNCGTTSDYWAFVHGPQPICSLPPPGFVEPIPPGECIVQDGQCSWSNCRSWLNWCQAGWECGTEYQYLQYQALPPPPCPFPGENYQPPIEPGECKFDVAAGSCQYDPCAVVFCAPGYRCIVSEVTGEAVCDPSCDDSNGGCPANQMCRITEIECLIQLCDNYRLISCQYPLSDSCQPDVDRCPSNSHCLTFNVTQERTCLRSCFLDNGGCGEDRVCVTSPLEEDCTTLARPCSSVGCVDTSDLKDDCPPGFEYTECGAACQTTCDNYQVSPLVCPAVCKPGCVCPQQLARYRDRCVDPLECSTLLRNPPPINPLPQPDGNTVVLIQLLLPGVSSVEFISEQEEVVSAVSVLLQQNGYLDVSVSVYAVVEMDENLQVVLQFTSDEMRPEKLDENEIAALIANGRDTISVDVAEVSVVEVPTFSDDDGLSVGAIAGIVIGALLFSAGAIVIIALIVYCFISQRKVTKIAMTSAAGSVAAKDTHPTSYSKLQEIASLENEYEES